VEVELLRSLVEQLLELVHDEQAAPRDQHDPLAAALSLGDDPARPTDPVLLRLFPDAYPEDDEAAAEFRRYTERGLREAKSSSATAVLASLAAAEEEGEDKRRLRLGPDEGVAWLRTLTDLRLALGTRLGVEQGDDERWASLPDDDPRGYVHDVYDWLGWVQETLVRALAPR
jgi:hypothetical protein